MQTTISAELLSLMMDGHVACQSKNIFHTECSIRVVAIVITKCSSYPDRNLCENAVRALGRSMSGKYLCAGCKKPAAECWQIRPI